MIKRLIFSDIDGTLYGFPSKKLLESTKQDILSAIKDDGVELILTTGNPLLPKLTKLVKELNSRYLICTGGSIIYDVLEAKMLAFEHINNELIKPVAEVINKYQTVAFLYGKENYYLLNETKEAREFFDRFFEYSNWKLDQKDCFKDKIAKIEIYPTSKEIKELIYADLLKIEGNIDVLNLSTHVEITKKGISKGSALVKLTNMFNADINYVMSVGDSENDIAMFNETQFAYAMDNASEVVKKAAKFYTSDVLQNGLGEAINDYIFRTRIPLIQQEKANQVEKWKNKEKRNEYYRNLVKQQNDNS
ncbi:Cof-type HAD-IIB family hydrolase [Mycoplasmopsis felifaucium]|uniref:Cof-type HAD-IIB family hydrolase n=1 Tax=Mycoplasmopsis felifaucium TaxID=35768 RepID=UPI00055FD0CE|nr:HAD family hydrolase [Mycoplasmopsis felifaucium]